MSKTILYTTGIALTVLALVIACTNKEINLVTNVELDFSQSNTSEGFVKELLPTTLTITPEVFLPEFEYSLEYTILEGQGTFITVEDVILPKGEKIILTKEENASNFFLNLNYQPTVSGIHKVQITASDNFEKAQTAVLTYSVKDLDIIWEATTSVTAAPLGVQVPLSLFLKNNSNNPTLTFKWSYRYTSGSGTLTDIDDNSIFSNQFNPIDPDTYVFNALPNEEGTTTIVFEVQDSNGQTITKEISFNVGIDPISDTTKIITFDIDGAIGIVNETSVDIVVPSGSDLASLTPTITIADGATINPESGTAQAFNGIVPTTYTVTAQDGVTVKEYVINISLATPSTDTEITAFTLEGETGVLDSAAGTIIVTLPKNIDLSSLTPQITVSPNATYTPQGAVDFTGTTTDFTVKAPDNTEKIWKVTVITSDIPLTAIVITPKTLQVNVNDGVDEQLIVSFEPSNASNQAVTWTSSDTTLATVDTSGLVTILNPGTVTIKVQSDENPELYDESVITIISSVTGISITTPPTALEIGETLEVIAAITPTNASNQTITWASSNPQVASIDENTGLVTARTAGTTTITATTQDGDFSKSIDIEVPTTPASTAADIISFAINTMPATIDGTNITLELPSTADLMNLSPVISISDGAMVTPETGQLQDFSDSESQPVAYTVTAEDGITIKTYNVTVTKETPLSSEKDILSFLISDVAGTINDTDIAITVPFGSNLASLTPTIAIADRATIDPESGTAQAFNGILPTTYTVTAEDGSTKEYVINVSVAPNKEADITAFSINGVSGVINGTTITVELPAGTNRSSLKPVVTISDLATVSPTSETNQDFTTSKTYTVTAQDGITTKEYSVIVNVPNSNPVAVIVASSTSTVTTLPINLDGSGSTDIDGDQLTYVWDFDDNGTSNLNSTVSHLFEIARTYTVKLTVNDGNGGSDTQMVDITVNTNTAPSIRTGSINVAAGLAKNITAIASYTSDPENDTLVITGISINPTKGTASISSDNKSIVYTPRTNSTGTDNLTYTITDGKGGNASGELKFNIKTTNFDKITGTYTAPGGATINASYGGGGSEFSVTFEVYSSSNFTGLITRETGTTSASSVSGDFTFKMPTNGKAYVKVFLSSGTIGGGFNGDFQLGDDTNEKVSITSGSGSSDLPIPRN